jgi:cytochrome aa3-600 menaquinol oxidase subunit 1
LYSEIISTFSRKALFGYKSMIVSIIGITFLSMIVWVHHFYTMGAGPGVNSIFSLTTMMIGIPTGVKMFNWLFTMRKGRIRFTSAMLWSLGFIPLFLIGGVTGVMLAMGAADYQYHNSLFLVAHFHYTLIPGVVFAIFAGLHYWWPKMFGHLLNEKIGKFAFWFVIVGFNLTFMPMFFLGLNGAVRRAYTYSASTGFGPLMLVSAIGGAILMVGILTFVFNIYWSARYSERNIGSDPWDARTLEWATASPVQYYNFAKIPEVQSLDAFWYMKKNKEGLTLDENELKEIHMPSNSGLPFITATIIGIVGFFLIFEAKTAALVAAVGIIGCLIARSWQNNDGYHIHTDEIKRIETAWRSSDKGVNNNVG